MKTRTNRLRRSGLVLLAAALLVSMTATGCRAADKSKPIVFVHGWSAGGGTSCANTFDGMISRLGAQGFTGPFVKVGFYTGDTGCDMTLRDWGNFDNGSSWKEVSKAFSKYVHTTYTSKGITIDAVGHSMGGNIIRGAVQGTGAGESGFSAPIRVEDVVSLGSPYDGAAWYTNLCLWGQCSHLKPGAADIKWLDANGNPQGLGGTEWTVMGSKVDDVVPAASALSMAIPDTRRITFNDVGHSDYTNRSDVVTLAGGALAESGK